MPKATPLHLRLRDTRHPVLYEINTGILLRECSAAAGRAVTLADIPDELIDAWASLGFDAIWLMGVWTRSDISRAIARIHTGLQEDYRNALPDVTPDDIDGSPYSVLSYRVAPEFGGNAALRRLRTRLAQRGLGLVLDFVCNHTSRDCPWVRTHPEWYINGHPGEDVTRPDIFFRADTAKGDRVLAFGKDAFYPGWTDSAQLNHRSHAARSAIIEELDRIAALCDGVRCDMAMLLLNDVFMHTWGDLIAIPPGDEAPGEFWQDAITHITARHPDFLFIAESYWNREWDLQQLGFRYTYDKTLYDRLLHEGATSVRDHLRAELLYQSRSLRFLENHDEPRAARALPSEPWHFAAALVTFTVPGMLLVHEGQMDGRTVRLPVQLRRRPAEPPNQRRAAFYSELLHTINCGVIREGEWQLLEVQNAWHENLSVNNFLAFWWTHPVHGSRMIVVNYAPHSSQCYIRVPVQSFDPGLIEFRDLLGNATYARDRTGLITRGMYFDLPGYGIHFFDVACVRKQTPA